MDRRQLKTREAVYRAFTSLLESKTYSSITIQDIIDEANIGRSTFYSHFQTKEDLLNVLCTEIFDHVFSEHLKRESTHDFSKSKDLRSDLTHILYHLDEKKGYIRSILSSDGGEVFMRYFREKLSSVFEKEIIEVPEDVPKDYYLHYLVSGFCETVRWWINTDSDTGQVMDYFVKLYRI